MKKLVVLALFAGLGLGIVGCSSSEEVINEPKEKIEQHVEEKEVEKVLTIEDEEFKKHMTNSLTDDEYAKYFEKIKGKEVDFNGAIAIMQLRDGYKTRMELLLTYGDYSETSITGPYMKVEDIAYGSELSREILDAKTNVKVKAKIEGYDLDKGYLVLDIISIERR